MKKSILFLAALLFAAPIITSCDDDDDNDKNKLTPEQQAQLDAALNKKIDPLDVLQVNLVKMDSLGNFVRRNNGAPLTQLNADTTHVFVGVENLQEASNLFVEWLGLSDESQLVKMGNNLTYTSTVSNKKVHFNESSEGIKGIKEIANITFDQGAIKHVSKVHFIPASMWPANVVDSPYLLFSTSDYPEAPAWYKDYCVDGKATWLCIREAKPGQCGVLISITKDKYMYDAASGVFKSYEIPNKEECMLIASITKADWSVMKKNFKERLGVEVADGDYYWADDYVYAYLFWAQRRAVRLKDGYYEWFETNWKQTKNRGIQFRSFTLQNY